jgi:hypothetical protein
MNRGLAKDLERLKGMAFGRLKHCGPLVKRFHAVRGRIGRESEPERIWNVYDWLLTPFTLWPLNFEEMAGYLMEMMGDKRWKTAADADLDLLLEILPEPPGEETQGEIAEFERVMEAGRYDPVLKQAAKFSEGADALMGEIELQEFWGKIKKRFDVSRFQNKRGVARRRVSGERNIRERFGFEWKDEESRFQALLDALCYRWNLYGMEKDNPLLMKVTFNPTPHGTLIFIPRSVSFDPHRDLNWKLFGRLHRCRVKAKQGPKLSWARMEKLKEAKEAKRLWKEAGRKGLTGDARYEYVRVRMKRDPRADRGWLWRMLRKG